MASKTASTLVKPTPAAASQHDRTVTTTVGANHTPAITTTQAVSSSSTKSKDNNIESTLSSLPSGRPRRGSSDDFGTSGSLGSVGGSAVGYGSSLEFSLSGVVGGLGTSSNSSSQNNNLKSRSPPSGRRPFRKRKASVDFSFPALSIDDSDSTYSVSQLLPQHHVAGPVKSQIPAGGSGGSSSLLMPPSPSNRNRPYSDLTIPEPLVTTSNNHIFSSSKQQQKQNQQRIHQDRQNNHQQEQILPSMDALPAMGDDSLPPIDNDTNSILLNNPTLSHPESPLSSTNQTSHSQSILRKDRGLSFASIRTEGHGVDRLDSLGLEATISASRIRKGSSVTSDKSPKSQENAAEDSINSNGNNSYDGTLGSQSHRFLMEAFLGDGTESLVLNPSQRERLGSFDVAAEITGKSSGSNNKDYKENNGSSTSQNNGTNILISRERLSSIGGRRNRLESWGGMSDLSVGMKDLKADQNLESLGVGIFTGGSTNNSNNSGSGVAAGSTDKTAALAATIYTSLANDVSAAAAADGNESVSSFLVSDEKIPTKISINRDRLNSIASIGTEASALLRFSATNGDVVDTEFPSDVHSFVQAAMASVEDQLADLATAVEAVSKDNQGDHDSEISSTASPMIGAVSDIGSNRSMDSVTGRPRSSSISSMLQISVDYDAVAAAVDAAEAAAGALDLSSFTLPLSAAGASSSSSNGSNSHRNRKMRSLPIQKKTPRAMKEETTTKKILSKSLSSSKTPKNRKIKRAAAVELPSSAKRLCVGSTKNMKTSNTNTKKLLNMVGVKIPVVPKTKLDDRDMEKLRERARAAAGYVPPSSINGYSKASSLPPKKRSAVPATPSHSPRPSTFTSGSNFKTPITSNTAASKCNFDRTPGYSAGTPASSTKGQSSQKWESMFDCLLKFIEQQKKDGTAGMTDEQRVEWAWDGNVPTTFKTKDGKALGRWVNNQRSAKSKGTLKKEREKRLVDAGLKWSVLASNSWNEMLEELRIYVADQIKQGKKWDGNVPTNYRIKVSRDKSKPFVKDDDEDKNLGRWVNRQRSMFQAGKLRKVRQLALEKIGLKWSMLATTSWESMFETLYQYVEGKKKDGNEWDGNVPANYRTEDVPPRALGRWINRQRSAYGKSKLKPEYVAKLNEIGLKWSIHERRPTYHQYTRPDTTTSSTGKVSDLVQNSLRKTSPVVTTQRTSSNPTPAVDTSTIKPNLCKSSNTASVVKKQMNIDIKEKQNQKVAEIVKPVIGRAESSATTTHEIEKIKSSVSAASTAQEVAGSVGTIQPVKDSVALPTAATTMQQLIKKRVSTPAVNVAKEQQNCLIQIACTNIGVQAAKTISTVDSNRSLEKVTDGERNVKIESET